MNRKRAIQVGMESAVTTAHCLPSLPCTKSMPPLPSLTLSLHIYIYFIYICWVIYIWHILFSSSFLFREIVEQAVVFSSFQPRDGEAEKERVVQRFFFLLERDREKA